MAKILQNFYKTTVTVAWGTGTGNLYLSAKPTSNTAGWLVVSPNSASLREIVAYSGTGTDGTGDYIVCTARGVGGTTAQTHAVAEPVRMNITAEHWADIFVNATFTGTTIVPTPVGATEAATKAYADGLAIAGSPDSTTTTKGIGRVSTAPASPTIPIFVGDNDPRVPTQGENDALAGTSGTPSSTNKFVTQNDPLLGAPTGAVSPYAGFTAPSGWLLADGASVSRTTYATLLAVILPSLGTVTMTIASPAVVSLTAHGLVLDDIVHFTTTGALPTGVVANTQYYVISAGLTADAFQFSATKGGAAVNSSGSQSGVHTLKRSPYGVGDGSTTFNVPNLKGSVPVGRDASQTEFNSVGETGGAKTHTLTVAEMPAHTHGSVVATGGPQVINSGAMAVTQDGTTASTGGGTAHNNLQPYMALNYIIKF